MRAQPVAERALQNCREIENRDQRRLFAHQSAGPAREGNECEHNHQREVDNALQCPIRRLTGVEKPLITVESTAYCEQRRLAGAWSFQSHTYGHAGRPGGCRTACADSASRFRQTPNRAVVHPRIFVRRVTFAETAQSVSVALGRIFARTGVRLGCGSTRPILTPPTSSRNPSRKTAQACGLPPEIPLRVRSRSRSDRSSDGRPRHAPCRPRDARIGSAYAPA
jgi:hypothetical protein